MQGGKGFLMLKQPNRFLQKIQAPPIKKNGCNTA